MAVGLGHPTNQFSWFCVQMKEAAAHFACWQTGAPIAEGAKAEKAAKSEAKGDKEFRKKLFRVFLGGVGFDWASGTKSPYSCTHDDGTDWFEKSFDKMK